VRWLAGFGLRVSGAGAVGGAGEDGWWGGLEGSQGGGGLTKDCDR
jgi:hypothetical protein